MKQSFYGLTWSFLRYQLGIKRIRLNGVLINKNINAACNFIRLVCIIKIINLFFIAILPYLAYAVNELLFLSERLALLSNFYVKDTYFKRVYHVSLFPN
jgi:hypothetical protein